MNVSRIQICVFSSEQNQHPHHTNCQTLRAFRTRNIRQQMPARAFCVTHRRHHHQNHHHHTRTMERKASQPNSNTLLRIRKRIQKHNEIYKVCTIASFVLHTPTPKNVSRARFLNVSSHPLHSNTNTKLEREPNQRTDRR